MEDGGWSGRGGRDGGAGESVAISPNPGAKLFPQLGPVLDHPRLPGSSSSSSAASSFSPRPLDDDDDAGTLGLPRPPATALTMSEILSLSLLQLLSVFSFLTSVLAVVCVGSGSLHKFRLDSAVSSATTDMSLAPGKHQLWNWSHLPVSFSINSLIGDDEPEEHNGYVGGSELARMDWQVGRSRLVAQTFDSRGPMSMAKLIMSRHVSTLFIVS
ncbi:hypothetical protein C2E23DRAFT_740273 [Lenzites betulinus]|nr:hypothetical protein C2E23DRAFT_740273 [Lenzites betulinus]